MENNYFFRIFDYYDVPLDKTINYSEKFQEINNPEKIIEDINPYKNSNDKLIKFDNPIIRKKKNLKPEEELKRLAFTYNERQRKNKINNSFDKLGNLIRNVKNDKTKLTRNEILIEACEILEKMEAKVLEKIKSDRFN